MSQANHHKRVAPGGMNTVLDRPQLPGNRCEGIKGFLPGRNGVLNPAYALFQQPHVIAPFGTTIEGFAYYADTPGSAFVFRHDYVIVVRDNGQVFAHPLTYQDNLPAQFPLPTLGVGIPLGTLPGPTSNYFGTFHVRSVQYRDELFLVQDQGGTQPQRIFKDPTTSQLKMVQCGIIQPPTSALVLADGGAGTFAAATYSYRLTWADEKKRQSSPSVTVSIALGATKKVQATITWPADPQVKYAYLNRAPQGTATYYQVQPDGTAINEITRGVGATTVVNDQESDATLLAAAITCPLPGQNNVPNRANMVCIHKDRLVLNDRTTVDNPANVRAQDALQISNLDSPTQFSVIGDSAREADGETRYIASQAGDEIMGICPWGSLLMIAKRHGMHELWGEGPADFEVRKRFDIGCVATDTFGDYGGMLGWLGVNGFYALSGDGMPILLSGDIEDRFTGYEYIYPL